MRSSAGKTQGETRLLIAAAFTALLVAASPAALAALRTEGPKRLEAHYELVLPTPVLGRQRAATASLVVDFGRDAYAARSSIRAEGLADWFRDDKLDIQSNGSLTAAGLIPRRYQSRNEDGAKNRTVVTDFLPGEVRVTAQPAYGDYGHPAATQAQRLEAMDPLAALAQLTLNPRATEANPCGPDLRIFDGKQRYDLKLSYGGRIDVKSRAWTGRAIKCSVEYVALAGFRAKTDRQRAREEQDLEWSTILLAEMPGGATPPLKIEARSKKRGKLTIQATRLAWGPAPASTTVGR